MFYTYNTSINKMIAIFIYILIIFGVDAFSFVLAFELEGYIFLETKRKWYELTPLTLMWGFALVVFIVYKIKRKKFRTELLKMITGKELKCCNEVCDIYLLINNFFLEK
jgi:hypothetical protein